MADSVLPEDFLSKPAEDITVNRIDFSKTDLPKYKGLYAVVLDNVLTPEECETFIKGAEASTTKGWERAMINIGGGRQRLMEDERCCGRIIWDSPAIVDKVWKRIEHLPEVKEIVRLEKVPKIFGQGPSKRDEVWEFSRPNERMRFLKYVGGEYFRPHCDGSYETPDRKERTYFTLHLYLSDAKPHSDTDSAYLTPEQKMRVAKSELLGGATTFHSINMKEKLDVLPVMGRVLLFQHRDLLHSGDDVLKGTKYTMRTDLLYSSNAAAKPSRGGY
ncbi:hypothetical protein LTR97_008284 [Elasticomyces elasticus]|uniref:Prolyl 4-hydroxylase alpha subunit domain-containing protein n=1 Tax=Elasticomyces elasticus TaxID=574655 RepID=A0AAN7W6X7_9PEZI|nr:hypothetical protein LTR97_008284 [Elasticomyces elasticus]